MTLPIGTELTHGRPRRCGAVWFMSFVSMTRRAASGRRVEKPTAVVHDWRLPMTWLKRLLLLMVMAVLAMVPAVVSPTPSVARQVAVEDTSSDALCMARASLGETEAKPCGRCNGNLSLVVRGLPGTVGDLQCGDSYYLFCVVEVDHSSCSVESDGSIRQVGGHSTCSVSGTATGGARAACRVSPT